MKYQAVIFDLDGTLLDTLDDLTVSTNTALEHCHLPLRTREEIRSFVGNGIRLLIERAVPAGTKLDQIDEVYRIFSAHYKEHCNDRTKPYGGIMKLLQKLKEQQVQMAIVSNKADFAVKELARLYFSDLIPVAIGGMENIRKKPAPDTVYRAMEELQCDPQKTVYVGDSDVDLETARNAGLPCISVTYGFRSVDFLLKHGAATLADSAEELGQILSES